MSSSAICSFNGPATTSVLEIWTSSERTVKMTHQWRVTNFASSRDAIDGPVFSVDYFTWHLRFYPLGRSRYYRGFMAVSAVSLSTFNILSGSLGMSLKVNGSLKKTAGKRLPTRVVQNTEVTFPDYIENSLSFNSNCTFLLECEIHMKLNAENGSPLEDTMTPGVSCLVDNLERLFENKTLSDVVIIAGGKEIRAHRVVLAAQSPVFAAMFENETSEKLTGRVDISDVKYEVLLQMIRFMYTGKTPQQDRITCDLLVAADKYQLDHLKKMCESALLCNLSADTATTNLVLADRHGAKELKAGTVSFIIEHAEEVQKTNGWTLMVHEYPQLVAELFSAATISRNNVHGAR